MAKDSNKTPKALARTKPGRRPRRLTKTETRLERTIATRTDTLEAGLSGIGRVTDALVSRVVGTGISREPTAINIECDVCRVRSPGGRDAEEATRLAERLGWQAGDRDYCPTHRPDRKLLGDGQAEPPPKELSTGDAILVTRMNWIGARIAQGFFPEALIQESFRLDRRSMLSDLARETEYSTAALSARVTGLITARAEIHDVFSERTRDVWVFFGELYRLLKIADFGEETPLSLPEKT